MGEPEELGERVAALEARADDSTRRLDGLEVEIKAGITRLDSKFDTVSDKYGKAVGSLSTYKILVPVLTAAIGAESAAIVALLMR